MWFGTMAGLNRFDGYNFRVFRHKPGDTTTLSDDFINQVIPGPHQLLWIQTPNGWNIYDPGKERFIVPLREHLAAMGLPNEEFSTIVPDAVGCYWFVVTCKGIYRYNPATHKSIFYNKTTGNLYSDNITGMATDRQGNIWIATRINSLVIRYADVLLMIAETYIQQGNPDTAKPFVNDVRRRSAAFEFTTLGSKDNAMHILMRERRLELAGEQSRYASLGLIKTGTEQGTKSTIWC